MYLEWLEESGGGQRRTRILLRYNLGDGLGLRKMPIASLVRFRTIGESGIYRGHSYVAVLDCKRAQPPLDLAYAAMTHKPQDLILPLVSTREKGTRTPL